MLKRSNLPESHGEYASSRSPQSEGSCDSEPSTGPSSSGTASQTTTSDPAAQSHPPSMPSHPLPMPTQLPAVMSNTPLADPNAKSCADATLPNEGCFVSPPTLEDACLALADTKKVSSLHRTLGMDIRTQCLIWSCEGISS